MITFDTLKRRGHWMPIRDCPGRWVLRDATETLSIAELVGDGVVLASHRTASARDTVWIASIEGGGVISYLRADGRWLHTLNTLSGLQRKLNQLGITIDPNQP